jgi:hypothetical protein
MKTTAKSLGAALDGCLRGLVVEMLLGFFEVRTEPLPKEDDSEGDKPISNELDDERGLEEEPKTNEDNTSFGGLLL